MLRAVIIAVILLLSTTAVAQDNSADKATARTLFEEAGTAMEAEDYAKAADLYARANALYPAPTSALGEARALVKQRKLVEASERYLALINKPLADDASDAFRLAVESARGEREVIVELLPALVITREGGGRISLDGEELAPAAFGVKRWVNPGTHQITVHMRGGDDITREITIAEGEVLPVDLSGVGGDDAERAPAASGAEADVGPSPVDAADAPDGEAVATQRIAGYALLGLGGVSLVIAIVTGGVYIDEKGTIGDECNAAKQCSQDGLDAVGRAETLGAVNAVTLFAGIAIAAAGLTVVLTAPDESEVALHPLLAPTVAGLGASVRF